MRPRITYAWIDTAGLHQASNAEKNEQIKRRLYCVALAVCWNFSTSQVAKITGFSEGTVRNLCSRYHRGGIDAVRGKPKGGRHRQHLTPSEEREFLWNVFKQCRKAKINVKAIKARYEVRIGHAVPASTVYRLLQRNSVPSNPSKMSVRNYRKMVGDLYPGPASLVLPPIAGQSQFTQATPGG
jgi:transposase